MEKIQKILITTASKRYPVFIGNGAVTELPKHLHKYHKNKRIVVITDNTVKKLHLPAFEKELPEFLTITIPPGEESKSREIKAQIEDALSERNFGKDTVLIAFGGGVVGDLTGFVASTYYRGVSFIQVPTTLLAMVDASIGGKTGINTAQGKNLVGTVYQPDAVIVDLEFMKTLPDQEFLNGLAEVIKMACILDKGLFQEIEKNKEGVLQRKEEILLPLIKRSIELKKIIVEKDEQETGLRQILNFGHTVGHALEKASNYSLKHGFAVSAGMAAESFLAVHQGVLQQQDAERIASLLKDFNLPVSIPKEIGLKPLLGYMEHDKKNRNQEVQCILLENIGQAKQEKHQYSFPFSEKDLIRALQINHD